MNILRTPEEAFENLVDFPYPPKYTPVENGLRMHYVDQGTGPVLLLLHGEPSWSYLYRKMIPILVQAGLRVVVPDLIGFGRSDKPSAQQDYTYAKHIGWLQNFIDNLALQDLHLFVQDWGGLLGLRLVAHQPHRFASIAAGNTMLPTGSIAPPKAFLDWQNFAATHPDFDIATVLQRATNTTLSPDELAAYNAPFPSEEYKAGARVFPALVPTSENDPEAENNKNAWITLAQWQKPFLTLFSDNDPITQGGDKVFQKRIPGCQNQAHKTLGGGHFLQEDVGPELAHALVAFIQKQGS